MENFPEAGRVDAVALDVELVVQVPEPRHIVAVALVDLALEADRRREIVKRGIVIAGPEVDEAIAPAGDIDRSRAEYPLIPEVICRDARIGRLIGCASKSGGRRSQASLRIAAHVGEVGIDLHGVAEQLVFDAAEDVVTLRGANRRRVESVRKAIRRRACGTGVIADPEISWGGRRLDGFFDAHTGRGVDAEKREILRGRQVEATGVRRGARRTDRTVVGVGHRVTILGEEIVLLEIGGTENQGALVVRESIDEFSALAADVVLISILVADIELRTVEVFLRDDVNNATHGIRTVGCAVTILQDVDVIHRAEWHRVQITGGGAATVDERQGRQATQANEGPTAAAVDERFVVVARTIGGRDELQVAAD